MKIILYASNNFQNLLCLEAVKEWMESSERLPHQTVFNGLVSLKMNFKSVTATYLYGRDTIMDFTQPKKEEEDKNQLKLKL